MPNKQSTQDDLRRRADDARRFPGNTCGASRHVHALADDLADGHVFSPDGAAMPQLIESIYAVLESLYRTRTCLHATHTITMADLINIADAACELDAMQAFFVDRPDEQANIKRRVEQLHDIVERASGNNSHLIYAPTDGS